MKNNNNHPKACTFPISPKVTELWSLPQENKTAIQVIPKSRH